MPDPHDLTSLQPYTTWDFHVVLDADWEDELPQFRYADNTVVNFTAAVLEMWIRPDANSTILLLLASTTAGTIDIDSAAEGLLSMDVDKADMQTAFDPAGTVLLDQPRIGEWYLRWENGGYQEELARGNIYIHPANDTPPPP